MSKYTPGPWKWELVEGDDKDDSLLVLMTEANEIPVAGIQTAIKGYVS